MNYDEFLSLYSILHTRQSRLKARDKENAAGLVSTPMTPRQRRRTLLPTTEINQSDQTPLITNSGPTSTNVTPGMWGLICVNINKFSDLASTVHSILDYNYNTKNVIKA